MGIVTWWRHKKIRQALLFSFWDGKRYRQVDGYRLWRRFRLKKELSDPLLLSQFQKDDPASAETYLAAAADVFEVERYDYQTKTGLTDGELLQLVCRFAEWVGKKKAQELL